MTHIVFRTDASVEIGTGHVMRCLTLASALKARGADCYFLCKDHTGHLMDKIHALGFPVFPLVMEEQNPKTADSVHGHWLGGSWKADATQCHSFLKKIQPHWVVVDHYGLDIRWEKEIRPCTGKIFVLDDLADRCHDCDILLDSGRKPKSQDYQDLVPPHCILLLGTDHLLLRDEFIRMRPESLKRRIHTTLRRILITMGGMDMGNATGRILNTLRSLPFIKELEVDIVLGSKAPHLETVRQQLDSFPCSVQMHIDTPSMAELMAQNDLAIGATGSTAWEFCCMGLPSILFFLAENQKTIANHLKQHEAAWIFENIERGLFELPLLLERIKKNPLSLQAISVKSQCLTDEKGTDRVVRHFFTEPHRGTK
ncbi:UDP-2,4-diacetamido-2,4,6-trideoxy-beta-L-altropyranose hydrolase [Desulfobotulus sp. H1]|uniref:UDP-2,4-diacetamido-2,4, 6-trideoxy-beta-L-altropyranose hydrolase n=1 Tax=Desulfobotulus pelophilus TaxID=2823377 RepID=A0ABT3N4L5_9BACT|nr:UDP-2,4-diacetamido-2,4,6-trideoxy-beta-L-altropyranose hydrolase [Desulfobotulus pelophilus]MCW7752394.1 UDP-2,4-diacetamido-2,4,6-trideoxy-beta-L-altropyranose hydrolase [Desulfobotulus pelophilus]